MRLALALALALAAPGCAVFDGPPEVTISGLQQGLLADATAPIVLSFSKTPVRSTIKVQMVDAGGKLPPFYAFDAAHGDACDAPCGDACQTCFSVDSTMTTLMTVTPDVAPAIGPSLLLLVEPGLSDLAGTVTHAERRVVFGYAPSLMCDKPVSVLHTGKYFFLVDVAMPIHVQVQMFGVLDIDPLTGAVKSRFTKARRNPDPKRCPTPCDAGLVCRLLPAPECVVGSTPADFVDQFSDYVPNPDPTTGFSFLVQGCATDQGGASSAFATEKVDVKASMPMVKLAQSQLNASFTPDDAGVLRGTGSLIAETVLLGPIDSGMGSGALTARSITDAEAPPGIEGP